MSLSPQSRSLTSPGVASQEIEPRVQHALVSSPVTSLRELVVELLDGALLIRGRVTSFYHKQLAQEIVLSHSGSLPVVNRIEVQTPVA